MVKVNGLLIQNSEFKLTILKLKICTTHFHLVYIAKIKLKFIVLKVFRSC